MAVAVPAATVSRVPVLSAVDTAVAKVVSSALFPCWSGQAVSSTYVGGIWWRVDTETGMKPFKDTDALTLVEF